MIFIALALAFVAGVYWRALLFVGTIGVCILWIFLMDPIDRWMAWRARAATNRGAAR